MAALLGGCAAPRKPAASSTPAAAATAATETHTYTLTTQDIAGNPLAGVSVDIVLESKGSPSKTVQCTSDEAGRCPTVTFEVGREPNAIFPQTYSSKASFKASKAGYYPATTNGFSSVGSKYPSPGLTDLKLKLRKPLDYLEDGFASSDSDKDLRDRVLRFLDVIRLQSVLNEAEVMLKGVGTSEFKGKKYLRLRIDSTTTYNSLKLNKYDMGKALFDETVRKVLNPLNDNIAAPRAYFGYDLVVYGHSKSFADKNAVANKVEYRFLMPEAAVRKYKDKDISGQALLDASVLLMDDERIELKLQ